MMGVLHIHVSSFVVRLVRLSRSEVHYIPNTVALVTNHACKT